MGMFSPLGCLVQVRRGDALGVFDLHHYRQVALVYKRPPHLNGTAGDFLRMLHRVGRGVAGARAALARGARGLRPAWRWMRYWMRVRQ